MYTKILFKFLTIDKPVQNYNSAKCDIKITNFDRRQSKMATRHGECAAYD